MSRCFALSVLLLTAFPAIACPSDTTVMTTTRDDGKTIRLMIAESQFAQAPKWKLGEGEPPVSISQVREAALAWAESEYSRYDSVEISSISLRESGGCSSNPRHWFYVVDFRPVIEGNRIWGSGNWAAVLLDGTVIGPTVSN